MTTLRLELDHDPRSASTARAAVRDLVVTVWPGSTEVLDDALIVTSELVGNAVRHGAAPLVLSAYAEEPRTLRLECRDGGTWREPSIGDGGRGLPLVRSLCDSVTVDRQAVGTLVVAVLRH